MRTSVAPAAAAPEEAWSLAHPPRASAPHAPVVIVFFGLACMATIAWRYWVLSAPGVPPGTDGGNWLGFGKDLLGTNVKPGSVVYPPVVPLLVTGLAKALGPARGLALMSSLSAVAPAVAAFVLLYWSGLRGGAAAILAAFLLPSSAISEVAAWSGFPQLLGTLFVLGNLWFLDRWLRGGGRRHLVGGAMSGMLLLAVSHFDAVIGVFAACGVVVIHLLGPGRGGDVLRRAGISGLVTLVFALPLAPVYAHLVPAILSSRNTGPSITGLTLNDLPSRFTSSLGGAWPLWALGLILLPVAVWLNRRDRSPLFTVTLGLAIGLALFLALTREARVLHEIPVLVVLGAGLWLPMLADRRTPSIRDPASILLGAAAVVALWAVASAGLRDLPNHRDFYNLLDHKLGRALEWIRTETPPGSLIAVSPKNDAPLGWWVEGISERPTLTGTPLRWLVYPEERDRAARANRIFNLLAVSSPAALDTARSYGVDYVLVARGSTSYFGVERLLSEWHVGAPVFRNSSAIIVRVGDGRSWPPGR